MHEWEYEVSESPKTIANALGELFLDRLEPLNNLITWVFDEGTFIPTAKITAEERYSIVTDYLGTPCLMYNSSGNLVWKATLDIYGNIRKQEYDKASDCPFRYQGQYEDEETGLYYNRFRYYEPKQGRYISQDPIGLLGNNPNFYAYVLDVNNDVDVYGLMLLSNPVNQGHHMVPHKAATDLVVKPFNSQTGVPSIYFDDVQFTGTEHSAMHGYNGIGSDTKPLVKANQIQNAGMDNDTWLRSLEKHYNNPALKDVRGDLHLINADESL